jgi:small subunit ribosomal protein S16
VAVKIRLKRLGKIRAPYYRIVVADSRTKRDGRAIEEIGKYHPTEDPSFIEIDRDRAQYWLGVGAQPTEQVMALLKITGDWQTFKGLPGTEGTQRFAAPRPDRNAIFDAASKQASLEPAGDAVTAKAKKVAAKNPPAPDDAVAIAPSADDIADAVPAGSEAPTSTERAAPEVPTPAPTERSDDAATDAAPADAAPEA